MPTPAPEGQQPPGAWGPPAGQPFSVHPPPMPIPPPARRPPWVTGGIVALTMAALIAATDDED